jgi:hypothetical protein
LPRWAGWKRVYLFLISKGKGKRKETTTKNQKLQRRVFATPNLKRIKKRGVIGNAFKH